jgi:ribosome recycling factor
MNIRVPAELIFFCICDWVRIRPTKEFRESLTKLAAASTEKAKTIIRKLRQDGMKELKKDLKAGMSEDENYSLEKKV